MMEEKQQGLHVAVVGATGAVGQQMIKTLEKRDFPIKQLTLLSSSRSAGTKIMYKDQEITVQEAKPESFEGVDIALFSAGGNISLQFAPEAVKRGAIVVDNTSAYRMDKNVPLVVPEVNPEDISKNSSIIANPNCSTIQAVVALKPLDDKYNITKMEYETLEHINSVNIMFEYKNKLGNIQISEYAIEEIVPDVEFLNVTSNIEEIEIGNITVYCFMQNKSAAITYRDGLSIYFIQIPMNLDEAIEFAKTIK